MSKGFSFHIGVNTVNKKHYTDLRDLRGAVNDALDFERVARDYFGYQSVGVLLNEEATTGNVMNGLKNLAETTETGDIVFITYSGHGGQVDDPNWKEKGDEPTDETWCLYDRQLIDDELFEAFRNFKKGVRIVVISDSCHSGTAIRHIPGENDKGAEEETLIRDFLSQNNFQSKELDSVLSTEIYFNNLTIYEAVQNQYKDKKKDENIEASVKLFAACQDHEVAFDGEKNGRFSEAILHLIETGKWKKLSSPIDFISVLQKNFHYPNPNLFQYGRLIPAFEKHFPLKVEIKKADVVSDKYVEQAPQIPDLDKDISIQPPIEANELTLTFKSEALLRKNIFNVCPATVQNIEFEGKGVCTVELAKGKDSLWSAAHKIARNADELKLDVEIESAIAQNFPVESGVQETRDAGNGKKYLPYWPPALTGNHQVKIGWHLDDDHTQIASVRDGIWEEIKAGKLDGKIRIAHIDTGYFPHHPALVRHPFINKELSKSFIKNEGNSRPRAYDHDYSGKKIYQGHGTGTLGILTGWKMPASQTGGEDLGFIGAIPFAETLVLRISDSTLIFNTKNFAKALNYAVDQGVEVVTISMGGKPGKKMVKAINRAYEKGVTIVAAAGNSIVRGLNKVGPHTIVYPARYQRVMAACGACHNHVPYDFEAQKKYSYMRGSIKIEDMQGNWGPDYYMTKALGVYSPNIGWLENSPHTTIKKTGGGTSSATPQLAAATALWLVKHREELKKKGYLGTWKQVEAVRTALFESADKTTFPEWKKYYGNGLLRLEDAIKYGVPNVTENMKSPKAKSTLGGVAELMDLFLNRIKDSEAIGKNHRETLMAELYDLIFSKTDGHELMSEVDLDGNWDAQTIGKVRNLVQNSPESTEWLKRWAASLMPEIVTV